MEKLDLHEMSLSLVSCQFPKTAWTGPPDPPNLNVTSYVGSINAQPTVQRKTGPTKY